MPRGGLIACMKHGRDDHNPDAKEELYVGTLFPRHRKDLVGPRLTRSLIDVVSCAVDVVDAAGMLDEEVYHSYYLDGDELSIASTRLTDFDIENTTDYIAITVNRRWESSFERHAGKLLVNEYVIDTRPGAGAIATSVDIINLDENGDTIDSPTNLGVIEPDCTGRMDVFRGEKAELYIPVSPELVQYTLEDMSCAWAAAHWLQETLSVLGSDTEIARYPLSSEE